MLLNYITVWGFLFISVEYFPSMSSVMNNQIAYFLLNVALRVNHAFQPQYKVCPHCTELLFWGRNVLECFKNTKLCVFLPNQNSE